MKTDAIEVCLMYTAGSGQKTMSEIAKEELSALLAKLEWIEAWCKQSQEGLTGKQVADAVVRMIDDKEE